MPDFEQLWKDYLDGKVDREKLFKVCGLDYEKEMEKLNKEKQVNIGDR